MAAPRYPDRRLVRSNDTRFLAETHKRIEDLLKNPLGAIFTADTRLRLEMFWRESPLA
jgi:hypothetical protein